MLNKSVQTKNWLESHYSIKNDERRELLKYFKIIFKNYKLHNTYIRKADSWLPGLAWGGGLIAKGMREVWDDENILHYDYGSGYMTTHLSKFTEMYI